MSERFTATTHQCHLTASNCHRQFRKGRVIIAKRWTSFEGQVEKAVRATLAEMVGHGRQSQSRANFGIRQVLFARLSKLKLVKSLVVTMTLGPIPFTQNGSFDLPMEEIH